MTKLVEETQSKYREGNPLAAREFALNSLNSATDEELVVLGAVVREFADFRIANDIFAHLADKTPENPDNKTCTRQPLHT